VSGSSGSPERRGLQGSRRRSERLLRASCFVPRDSRVTRISRHTDLASRRYRVTSSCQVDHPAGHRHRVTVYRRATLAYEGRAEPLEGSGVPGIEHIGAASLEVSDIMGHDNQIMYYCRCREEAIDDGKWHAALEALALQGAPSERHGYIDRKQPLPEPHSEVVREPGFKARFPLGVWQITDALLQFTDREHAQKQRFVGLRGKPCDDHRVRLLANKLGHDRGIEQIVHSAISRPTSLLRSSSNSKP
jgi:hypothetical protein